MTRTATRIGLVLAVGLALAASAAPVAELDGRVVDAATGAPVVGAVVLATWTDRAAPDAGGKPRTRERAKETSSIVGGRFNIEPPAEYADVVTWQPLRGRDPLVRVYAPGYRRLTIENRADAWKTTGKMLKLVPLQDTEAARAGELKGWKRDIEATLAASGLRGADAAFHAHERLLLLFDSACARLQAPPAGLCYGEDTPAGRYLARVKDERAKYVVVDQPGGLGGKYAIRGGADAAPRAASGAGSSSAAGYPGYPNAKP